MSDDDRPQTGPKITPLCGPGSGPPTDEYADQLDPFGRPGELHRAESPEAATHHDARHWRRDRIGP